MNRDIRRGIHRSCTIFAIVFLPSGSCFLLRIGKAEIDGLTVEDEDTTDDSTHAELCESSGTEVEAGGAAVNFADFAGRTTEIK